MTKRVWHSVCLHPDTSLAHEWTGVKPNVEFLIHKSMRCEFIRMPTIKRTCGFSFRKIRKTFKKRQSFIEGFFPAVHDICRLRRLQQHSFLGRTHQAASQASSPREKIRDGNQSTFVLPTFTVLQKHRLWQKGWIFNAQLGLIAIMYSLNPGGSLFLRWLKSMSVQSACWQQTHAFPGGWYILSLRRHSRDTMLRKKARQNGWCRRIIVSHHEQNLLWACSALFTFQALCALLWAKTLPFQCFLGHVCLFDTV